MVHRVRCYVAMLAIGRLSVVSTDLQWILDPGSYRIIGMDRGLLPRLMNFFGLGGKDPSDKEIRIGLLGASQVPRVAPASRHGLLLCADLLYLLR